MFELSLYIPLNANDGESFTSEHHAVFEAFVAEKFGGVSRLPGTIVEGTWIDAGVTYRDQNIVFAIAIRSITDGSSVREVVDFAKSHYRQLAVFVRYLGVAEIL